MSETAFKTTGDIDPNSRIDGLAWLFPDQHVDDMRWPEQTANTPDASMMGGIAVNTEGQTFGVKAPSYRLPADRYLPGKYEQDAPTRLKGLSRDPNRDEPDVAGVEAELMAYWPNGEPFSLRNSSGNVVNTEIERLVGNHPELWAHTAEIETALARPTSHEAIADLKSVMIQLFKALPEEVLIDPASAWMEEQNPNMSHVTPHPYVHVMIEALGDQVMNFVGHGIHEHYDVDPEHILFVAQYLQMLSPYLNAGLQSAPYMHGERTPHLSETFADHSEVDLLAEVEKESEVNGWYSIRYPARYFGSSAGGVRANAYSSHQEFMRTADRKLRDGVVNNVSRADGPHGDVRQRFDLPPGRVELCVKDNPLGNLAVLKAYMDLAWGVVNALVNVSQQGDVGREKMHSAFADLFGSAENPSEMTGVYERVHRNSLVIAKNGPSRTEIHDAHGTSVSVRHQIERIFDFIRANGGNLPQSTVRVVRNTLGDPRDKTKLQYGANSADYYRTNYATPADYIRMSVEIYMEQGMSSEAAMKKAQQDRMQAFSAYILRQS